MKEIGKLSHVGDIT